MNRQKLNGQENMLKCMFYGGGYMKVLINV